MKQSKPCQKHIRTANYFTGQLYNEGIFPSKDPVIAAGFVACQCLVLIYLSDYVLVDPGDYTFVVTQAGNDVDAVVTFDPVALEADKMEMENTLP